MYRENASRSNANMVNRNNGGNVIMTNASVRGPPPSRPTSQLPKVNRSNVSRMYKNLVAFQQRRR